MSTRLWRTITIILLFLSTVVVACQGESEGNPQPLITTSQHLGSTPLSSNQSSPSPPVVPGAQLESKAVSILDTVEYEVRESLRLVNQGTGQPDKQDLWIALIGSLPPYQEVLSMEISPGNYRTFSDEYGNQFAEFDFSDMPPGAEIPVEIQYQVAVNQLAYNLTNCEGELPDLYTQPELHIESDNPQTIDLARQLSQGKHSACEKIEAIYNYIGNHLVYSYNGASWGAQAALGEMGADCTEYSSLMIALSRAMGIPAQYFEGVLYLSKVTEGLARTEHAWLQVYLPGMGWAPMDPTMGRSPQNRRDYFARIPPDHIIVTRGRNPSTLRGASYFTHLYWPGNSTQIQVEDFGWVVTPAGG